MSKVDAYVYVYARAHIVSTDINAGLKCVCVSVYTYGVGFCNLLVLTEGQVRRPW